MFYSLIKQKRDIWYNSQECTVKELIKYMEVTNELRDVQIDAIKTYLFLKIACNNKPLWELFYEGAFNTLDVSTLELAQNTRDYLLNNPYALLYINMRPLKMIRMSKYQLNWKER